MSDTRWNSMVSQLVDIKRSTVEWHRHWKRLAADREVKPDYVRRVFR